MTLILKDLFESYKSILESDISNSELYKWQAIEHFQKNWDTNAIDFFEMFKQAFSKRSNLMFQNSFGFLNSLSKEMPEEAKKLFELLFDDEVPLENRIVAYQSTVVQLLPKVIEQSGKMKLNHQQDERTISFLLTLHNPEKYYLYKDNVYQWLCQLKQVKPKEAGQKYFHFCELAENELVLIKQNEAIKNLTQQFIPKDFPFDSTKLIFQDILYRTMPRTDEIRKVYFQQLTDEVRSYLESINHPLAEHVWRAITKNYRWISIWKDEQIDPYFLHYEITLENNQITIELHPEGSEEFKKAFEPFMSQINKGIHTTKVWHFGLVKNQKGNYHKIVSKAKGTPYGNEVEPTTEQIQTVAERLIEYYDNYQRKMEVFIAESNFFSTDQQLKKVTKPALNQILYGPPGTGKTYSTIDKVVSICEPKSYVEGDHDSNKTVYDQLVRDGRVVFTTFHQSMAYEDFIEGIKPSSTDNSEIRYDVVDGIFKEICDKAKGVTGSKHTESNFDFNNTTYWKMSLGGKNRPEVSDWCIENNFIALGWGGDNDCSSLHGVMKWESFRDKFIELFPEKVDESAFNIQAMYAFQNWMKKGDVVVISKGNKIIEAVGVIEGEYTFIQNPPFPYHHTRKVRWLATNMNAAPSLFLDINISQQTIYRFNPDDVKTEEFKKTFGANTFDSNQKQNYALVIDEINRGNVSAIFGELITLIEEDKRKGKPNELSVTLPYSKESFSVPSNLYIIGTMNTADRSVEALDTALRRRFSFVEMLPEPKLLSDKGTNGDGMIADINLRDLLTIINDRIEVLVDRDHTIGHAFFINDKSPDDLKHTFKNKIIPLLQEYFYGNYQKMALVLGNSFFSIKEQKSVKFAEEAKDYDFSDQVYTIRDCTDKDFDFLNAIRKLMNKPLQEDNKQAEAIKEPEIIEADNG